MNPLDIVKGSQILKSDELSALAALSDELRQTWETVQVFRTRTEMEVSVLTDMKRPTPDSKYWQAVREQNVMFGELVNLSYEYRKKAVETRKMERDLEPLTDELDRELKQIEIEQNQWHLLNMERAAHDRIREILEWSDIKTQLVPHLRYGTEDVNAHQLEAMRLRYSQEANFITEQTPIADARNIMGLAEMAMKDTRSLIKGGKHGIRQIK